MQHPKLLGLIAVAVVVTAAVRADDQALATARSEFRSGQTRPALRRVDEFIAAHPNDAGGYRLRGEFHAALRDHARAVSDLTRAVELKPDPDAIDLRGSEHFKLGKIAESAADFDRYLELRPAEKPEHWRRGITLYYAGRFKDGVEQFEVHQTVNPDDVENAVWHYLCNAKVVGAETARQKLLKTGHDRRVPMMTIYKLFAGQAQPEDVLRDAEAGDPPADRKKVQLFYAHLYLGLYFESAGDARQALEHMTKAAVDYANPHYMGDVARVHVQLRRPKP
jgi:lipoprotein NlpI